jgi:hypothetical protein
MNLNPATVLNPVFNALDDLIQNYGVYSYLVFVWLSLGAIACLLGGGLRRKRSHDNSATVIPGIIFTMQPPIQPPPPIVTTDVDPAQNDDNEIMGEP